MTRGRRLLGDERGAVLVSGLLLALALLMVIGVAVDGSFCGRDAVVLGSLLERATCGELMLIAVHEEPLIPVALPGGMSWSALEKRARRTLAETRDSLAPDARLTVQADVLVWRGLRHVVRREHRDLSTAGASLDVRGAIDDGVAGGLRTEQIALEGTAVTERQLISAFERDLAAASGTGVPTNLEVKVGMSPKVRFSMNRSPAFKSMPISRPPRSGAPGWVKGNTLRIG